ncbi:MAG: MFS transporter [Acidobacteriaceae bacterium]|nr:MFS transporter [Acidobacteriaceae bacterium]
MKSPVPTSVDTTIDSARTLKRRQLATIALLFAGYAAYYFCRSDLSVAMPMLVEYLHTRGMTASAALVRLGAISSLGVIAYMAGKLCLTGLGDLWGGRRTFLTGMAGALFFTILFGLSGGMPLFTLAWLGNRLTQSIGWAGLVKLCSKWFSYKAYGTVIGILSLSFLVGDAVARQSMGMLIQHGYSWRALFYFAAIVTAAIFAANFFFLRESRTALGFSEPQVNPLSVFQANSSTRTIGSLLKPLLSNQGFWIVCLLSLGCTLIRETFNLWAPTYLSDSFSYSHAFAAKASAIFPAVGAVSVLLSGWVSDRLGETGRAIVMLFGLVDTALALLALTSIRAGTQGPMPIILLGLVAFGLLGPYSYLGGALALDFGGSQGGATSSGIIDGVGYIGGVFAGSGVAQTAIAFGWHAVFLGLAIVSLLSAAAAALLLRYQRRRRQYLLSNDGL